MNFLEALEKLQQNPDMWLRPESWRKLRRAYCLRNLDNNHLDIVPGFRGGTPAYFPDLREFAEQWEVVTPDEVLNPDNCPFRPCTPCDLADTPECDATCQFYPKP